MRIVNCKLKIISVTAMLFLIVVPVVFVIFTPAFVQAAKDCGQAEDDPATLVNETLSCSLVPCNGIDCTICHFFKLFQNIFNLALKLVPMIAILLVCWGGYYFLVGAGEPAQITKAKSILKNTFIGIVIFYSSYTLASFTLLFFATPNGALNFGFTSRGFTFNCPEGVDATGKPIGGIRNTIGTLFPGGVITIDLPGVSGGLAPDGETEIGGAGAIQGEVIKTGENIFSIANMDVYNNVRYALNNAGAIASYYPNTPFSLLVVSGRRDLAKQNALVKQNCTDITKSSTCEPPTCIPALSAGCPHVKGLALDVWAADSNGGQNKAMQAAATQVMKQAGFCVYKKEAWHFELKSNLEGTPRLGAFYCN